MQAVKNSFHPNYLLGTLLVPDGIHGLSDLLRQCQNTPSYGNNNYLKNIENRNIALDSGPHVRLPSGARRGAPARPCRLTAPRSAQHSRIRTALSHALPSSRIPHAHRTRMALLASWKWSRSTAIDTWKKNLPPAPPRAPPQPPRQAQGTACGRLGRGATPYSCTR